MKTRIITKLKEIEAEKNIKILFACESGSRAWGFPSPDSDYDVRFIYVHNAAWYLNLWEKRDTIQFMTSDLLDGSGWDLRKALRLLAKSNASLLGWLYSPMVYFGDELFLKDIQRLAKENNNPVSTFFHFHSMSKRFLEFDPKDKVKLKSLFYAMRTALAATWAREKGTIPPVLFYELLELVSEETKEKIVDLIKLKESKNEDFLYLMDASLYRTLEKVIEKNEAERDSVLHNKFNQEDFNSFFVKYTQQ
ncbi:MAG: nucleotidyltransferase domain-containing protein [Flavobacteriales bacterium]